jgi:hypothetical protein
LTAKKVANFVLDIKREKANGRKLGREKATFLPKQFKCLIFYKQDLTETNILKGERGWNCCAKVNQLWTMLIYKQIKLIKPVANFAV